MALLRDIIIETAELHPDKQALWVNGESLTYGVFFSRSAAIACALHASGFTPGSLCVLLGFRRVADYTGLAGAILAGGGYVPTNITFPAVRNATIIELSHAAHAVVDIDLLEHFRPALSAHKGMTIISEGAAPDSLKEEFPRHTFVDASAYIGSRLPEVSISKDSLAYLLFTSGTTGAPKGVGITHANVAAYIAAVGSIFSFGQDERFIQLPDLTFDLSVHAVWMSLAVGAAIYVPDKNTTMLPARFVKEHAVTQWASVTSVVGVMRQLGILEKTAFPSIRGSIFCGEALPYSIASAWARATPNGRLLNFYGPTEATCACTFSEFSFGIDMSASPNDFLPIGGPFINMEAVVVDEGGNLRPDGEKGQLLLAGAQLAPGYFENPQRTAESFVRRDFGHGEKLYYATGDLVVRGKHGLHYLGRMDTQIKYNGYRIELSEIEAVLRDICRTSFAAVLDFPYKSSRVESLVAFLPDTEKRDAATLKKLCSEVLPPYMLPARFIFIGEFPVNANGKVDRAKLATIL